MKLQLIEYYENSDLPEAVRRSVPDDNLQTLFRAALNSHLREGRSEMHSYIKAYRMLSDAGYGRNVEGMWVKKDSPGLADVHVDRPLGSDKKKPKDKDDPGTQNVTPPPVTELRVPLPFQKADKVTFDIPLFIRLLETAREKIKEDEPLHAMTERIVALMEGKSELTMADYDAIMNAIKKARNGKTKDDPGTQDVDLPGDPVIENPPVRQLDEVTKRISGNAPISLNAKGRELADRLGQRIALRGGLDILHSSPLPRATETADAIARHNPEMKQSEPNDALRPWRLGDIEGKEPGEVKNLVQHYIEHPDEVPPGKGRDGKPAESFNAAMDRQLDFLSGVYKDHQEHPNWKIGVVMHSRGMELLQSWVDVGCPENYRLDEKDLLRPDDPEHADVLRWHKDKIKEVSMNDEEELKPGVYLILHSLTDDDTDEGNKDLYKKAVITLFLPPLEVHQACAAALAAEAVIDGITEPLAKGEGIRIEEIRKIAGHLGEGVDRSQEPEVWAKAWGGPLAAKWAVRVLRKFDVGKAEEEEGEWVTINGQHLLISDQGEVKGGNPLLAASFPHESSKAELARKHYSPAKADVQREADRTERSLAKALGAQRSGDNSPFDLKLGRWGIEVKTFTHQKNGKVTMNKEARSRKVAEARREKLKMATVVADKRSGQTKYYFTKGVGSFRLGSFKPMTLAELKEKLS